MPEFENFIKVCLKNGIKITPPKRIILYFLYNAKEPLSAYTLLEQYRSVSKGAGDAMTIYRALSYLEKKNLVHKIHSQNKYSLCDFSRTDCANYTNNSSHHSDTQFFLCNHCHQVKEIHTHYLEEIFKKIAEEYHFNIQHSTLELLGICQTCQHSLV